MFLSSRPVHGTGVWTVQDTALGIGFNNFWQFPQLVATYGGGAFLIIYLICLALIGAPLLMAELVLGRSGRRHWAKGPISDCLRDGETFGPEFLPWRTFAAAVSDDDHPLCPLAPAALTRL